MASTSASRIRAPTLRTIALYLAESLLYGVQIRRVGRQEQKLRPSCFNELSDLLCPVRSEPIEHYYLPLFEDRCQEVLHVSFEG
jgi:hypothetical protein